MTNELPHTDRTQALLRDGKREKAMKDHNARVAEQLQRAQEGETINLSDLMAAREEIVVDSFERERRAASGRVETGNEEIVS